MSCRETLQCRSLTGVKYTICKYIIYHTAYPNYVVIYHVLVTSDLFQRKKEWTVKQLGFKRTEMHPAKLSNWNYMNSDELHMLHGPCGLNLPMF